MNGGQSTCVVECAEINAEYRNLEETKSAKLWFLIKILGSANQVGGVVHFLDRGFTLCPCWELVYLILFKLTF